MLDDPPNTRPRAREAIAHGGDLDTARARFPDAPEPWIDLSTGINPNAYPVAELSDAAWQRLPLASDLLALLEIATRRYGARDHRSLVAAPGTQALIQVIPRLVPKVARVAILGPTYEEHRAAWALAGHEVETVMEPGALEAADVAVVVNPNNPTGRCLPVSMLAAIAERMGARGGLLVVDEAFADFCADDVSLVPNLPAHAVVLRSFGKAYGLAGVRLGFAVTERGLAEEIATALGPWAVSGPAIAIAREALADEAWLSEQQAICRQAVARLDAMMSVTGAALVGGTPLFRLFAHPRGRAVADHLDGGGIHVRCFVREPTWLRLGLPGPEWAWQRLEARLREPPLG